MRERAVGQRIMMYWHIDDSFYPATITAFDELHYRHRVEHDDGDIEPAVKLWEAQVNLEVCTLIQSLSQQDGFLIPILFHRWKPISSRHLHISPDHALMYLALRTGTRREEVCVNDSPVFHTIQTHRHKNARALSTRGRS
jgi:hypothetical protein